MVAISPPVAGGAGTTAASSLDGTERTLDGTERILDGTELMRIETVARLDDLRLVDYRNVRDPDLRQVSVFLAEGRKNVERLLASTRFDTRSVFVTEPALRAIAPALEDRPSEIPVYLADQALMNEVVGVNVHRGCLAAGERGSTLGVQELLTVQRPTGLVLVLEDVTNADNVGGIFRNALAFGVGGVLLTPRCVDPLYRKSLRVSMGASLCIPFARASAWPRELQQLREAGFHLVALSADPDAQRLTDWKPPAADARVALLLGAEGEGLSSLSRAAADALVTIPMGPGIDSLNVATASGIALHHLAGLRGRS